MEYPRSFIGPRASRVVAYNSGYRRTIRFKDAEGSVILDAVNVEGPTIKKPGSAHKRHAWRRKHGENLALATTRRMRGGKIAGRKGGKH